mmetsp:Transcript_120725/g.240425  ORF Transcript_120725/g.240425 Transcript_120725/m.240425 type:complete len:127 (+) Transcript_120725:399-779(+)
MRRSGGGVRYAKKTPAGVKNWKRKTRVDVTPTLEERLTTVATKRPALLTPTGNASEIMNQATCNATLRNGQSASLAHADREGRSDYCKCNQLHQNISKEQRVSARRNCPPHSEEWGGQFCKTNGCG